MVVMREVKDSSAFSDALEFFAVTLLNILFFHLQKFSPRGKSFHFNLNNQDVFFLNIKVIEVIKESLIAPCGICYIFEKKHNNFESIL